MFLHKGIKSKFLLQSGLLKSTKIKTIPGSPFKAKLSLMLSLFTYAISCVKQKRLNMNNANNVYILKTATSIRQMVSCNHIEVPK